MIVSSIGLPNIQPLYSNVEFWGGFGGVISLSISTFSDPSESERGTQLLEAYIVFFK